MEIVEVPDVPHPMCELCYVQAPTMVRCDRKAGHGGRHTWEVAQELQDLKMAAKAVCEGFDVGVFCRDITHDHESGWAIRAMPYLAALGNLLKGSLL